MVERCANQNEPPHLFTATASYSRTTGARCWLQITFFACDSAARMRPRPNKIDMFADAPGECATCPRCVDRRATQTQVSGVASRITRSHQQQCSADVARKTPHHTITCQIQGCLAHWFYCIEVITPRLPQQAPFSPSTVRGVESVWGRSKKQMQL